VVKKFPGRPPIRHQQNLQVRRVGALWDYSQAVANRKQRVIESGPVMSHWRTRMKTLLSLRDSRVKRAAGTVAVILGLMLAEGAIRAQDNPDERAIRQILDSEVTTWNKGDADGYSGHFATDGTFTNIRGMFFTGHQEFRDRHEAIFTGEFRGTSLKQEIVSLRFIRPDVAVAETLTWVSGFSKAGAPPGTQLDANGRLRTRLLQVLRKDGGEWKIVVYHNVDVKPGVAVPEPR
jgi:uncharacterized protein (TIGR02246 family)